MQNEFFGVNSIKNIGKLINEYNPQKLFLVCGKKSFEISGAKEKIESFIEDISFTIFNPAPNPEINEIMNGISLFKKINPDLVMAIGGGSIIDSAKAINILSFQDDDPALYIIGEKKLENNGKPLIAIPTTAGTGSESTKFATIYINNKKYSLESEKIIPDIALVDPVLTYSLPSYPTACSGLDALCQGIESYWSINSTEESREYAADAIKLAYKNIEKAIENDMASRTAMAKAAHLSGKAINISKTTACHSVSYPLTSYFGVPHGHAVALIMPSFLEFNSLVSEGDCNDDRGVGFVMKRMSEIFSIMGVKDGTEAKEKFSDLLNNILEKTRLRDFGIDCKDLEMLLKESFTPNRMNNNPRRVSKEDLRKILEDMW